MNFMCEALALQNFHSKLRINDGDPTLLLFVWKKRGIL